MQRPMDCLRDRFGGEAANGLEAVFQDAEKNEAKLAHFLSMAETSPQAAPCVARAETEQKDILDLLAKMALYAPEVWYSIVTGLDRPDDAKNDYSNIGVAFDASSRVRRAGLETYHQKLSQAEAAYDGSYVYLPLPEPEHAVVRAKATAEAPAEAGAVRLVAISDTHLLHQGVHLPAGDVLVHCGDLSYEESRSKEGRSLLDKCRRQGFDDPESFANKDFEGFLENLALSSPSRAWLEESCPDMFSGLQWLSRQTYEHLVLVAGNHDFILEQLGTTNAEKLCSHFGIKYLYAALKPIALDFTSGRRLRIWGSAVSSHAKLGRDRAIASGNLAFQLDMETGEGEFREQTAHLQPLETDVLITHGPPNGCLYGKKDRTFPSCINELLRRVRPALFLCGHAHNPDGMKLPDKVCKLEGVLGVHCAVTGVWNQLTGYPFVVDLPARACP
ncbi:unnamed protein product [Effrenium voratum]|nr:unnamed protein product [Effrenium voratum]